MSFVMNKHFVDESYTVHNNKEHKKTEARLIKQGYKLIEETEFYSYYEHPLCKKAEIYRKY